MIKLLIIAYYFHPPALNGINVGLEQHSERPEHHTFRVRCRDREEFLISQSKLPCRPKSTDWGGVEGAIFQGESDLTS